MGLREENHSLLIDCVLIRLKLKDLEMLSHMDSLIQKLKFEPGELTDLDEIMVIEQASFSHPWTEGMVLSELFDNPFATSFVLRAGKNQTIVAYVFMRIVLEELHLMDLAVHPAWRRRGIGEGLIQKILSTAREKQVEKIILEVRVSNQAAQSLYKKFGFVQAGERRNYYFKPRENAFLFQYDLLEKQDIRDSVARRSLKRKQSPENSHSMLTLK